MSFDRIAPHYRRLETIVFGNKLQAARVAFIDQLSQPNRVLIVGEGNGRFLRELLDKVRSIDVDCVDASARMLQLARGEVSDEARVHFLQEDLLAWSPQENAYDLIVTHFFLDCFTENEIARVVAKLARAAKDNALWLLADFSIPPAAFENLHARAWLWLMHGFFAAVAGISARCLTNPSPFLEAHRFRCANRRNSQFGMLKSELWRRSV